MKAPAWKTLLLVVLFFTAFADVREAAARGPQSQLPLVPDVTGRLFYVNAGVRENNSSIWVVDLQTGDVDMVRDFTGQFFSVYDLVVSADGERLAFEARPAGSWNEWAGQVWVMNTDGSDLQLVARFADSKAIAPRWSPNDFDVLYYIRSYPSRVDELRRVQLATSTDEFLTTGTAGTTMGWDISNDESEALMVRQWQCCWHPNAFLSYQTVTGSGLRILQNSDGRSEASPRINREDGWIVLVDEVIGASGDGVITILDPNGGSQTRLTSNDLIHGYGSAIWLGGDHGGYVAFATKYFGQWEIVAMRADPSEWPDRVIHLSQGPGMAGYPAWTPFGGTPADVTPPVVTANIQGTPGTDGWYTSDIFLSWTVTDSESAITEAVGCDAAQVTEDTVGLTFTCQATSAGGTSVVSVTLKRDTNPPTASCAATPSILWPPNHQLREVTASATASDTGSTARLIGFEVVSNEPDNGLGDGDTQGDIQGFPAALTSTGMLRAERAGGGTGRFYSFLFTMADAAGNSTTCSTRVAVPHSNGK